MAYELPASPPETVETGLNTTTAGLAGVTPPPEATGFEDTNTLGKIGLALQGFGAGIQGQDPLFLKLRRQRMLEQQQTQEHEVKMLQYKQTRDAAQSKQVFDIMASDVPVETKLGALQGLTNNPLVKNMAPLLNKQVLSIATPEVMKYLRPARQLEVETLRKNPSHKPEGGWDAVEIELKDAAKRREEHIKTLAGTEAKNQKYREVIARGKETGWDNLDDADQQFLIDFKGEQAKRAQEFLKVRQEIELGQATTALKKTEAKRPHTLQSQMGDEVVTLQEKGEPGSGQYEILDVGGKQLRGEKKPLVSITQADTPEQAGKRAMFTSGLNAVLRFKDILFAGGDAEKGAIDRHTVFSANLGDIQSHAPAVYDAMTRLGSKLGVATPASGNALRALFKMGLDARARASSGAAMRPDEEETFTELFHPRTTDSDTDIRLKANMFLDFMQQAVVFADPSGEKTVQAFKGASLGDITKVVRKRHPDWDDRHIAQHIYSIEQSQNIQFSE